MIQNERRPDDYYESDLATKSTRKSTRQSTSSDSAPGKSLLDLPAELLLMVIECLRPFPYICYTLPLVCKTLRSYFDTGPIFSDASTSNVASKAVSKSWQRIVEGQWKLRCKDTLMSSSHKKKETWQESFSRGIRKRCFNCGQRTKNRKTSHGSPWPDWTRICFRCKEIPPFCTIRAENVNEKFALEIKDYIHLASKGFVGAYDSVHLTSILEIYDQHYPTARTASKEIAAAYNGDQCLLQAALDFATYWPERFQILSSISEDLLSDVATAFLSDDISMFLGLYSDFLRVPGDAGDALLAEGVPYDAGDEVSLSLWMPITEWDHEYPDPDSWHEAIALGEKDLEEYVDIIVDIYHDVMEEEDYWSY